MTEREKLVAAQERIYAELDRVHAEDALITTAWHRNDTAGARAAAKLRRADKALQAYDRTHAEIPDAD